MRKVNKLILIFLLSAIFTYSIPFHIRAEGEYYLADVSKGKKEIIEYYDDYTSANYSYLILLNDYDNLVLYENDKVIKMEYGVVEFASNDACSLNIEYRSQIRNSSTSINACYGIDAAYLNTSNDGKYIYFKYSGDIGMINSDDVILHPYELLDVRISTYENINGSFNHKIKTQLDLDYYSSVLELDKSLSFLNDNVDYYSYDGHYFYDDFYKMIDDYKNDTYTNAINDVAYYNYYMYLPQRSLTNYEYSEIEDYFYNVLKINGKINNYDDQAKDGANDVINRSQYYGELDSFFAYQNIYGVNALMSLAVSINESAYGKNFRAYSENNLFYNSAYDSDSERNDNHYSSISDSVYSYTKYYISDRYCNYRNSLYNGSFFGNKLSGMNVEYSLDAYWGERAASNYYKLDKNLGFKDYNSYCLGIILNGPKVNFYTSDELKRNRFTINGIEDYSLIILNKNDNSYKVQVDPSFSSDYLYDFDNSIAYVDKEYFDYVMNEDNMHQNELIKITFDGNGGTFNNSSKIEIKFLKDKMPITVKPQYTNYLFNGFEEELSPANEEKTYTAKYKKIKSIDINSKLDSSIELGSYFDLRGVYLTLTYENNHKEKIPVDSNMLSGINIYQDGTQNLNISYCGLNINKEINVSKYLNNLNDVTRSLIQKNINSFDSNNFNLDEIKEIKNNLSKVNYNYDFNDIRIIDQALLLNDDSKYHIDDNNYDLSVSGLSLSLPERNKFFLFKPISDTYYVHIKNANNKHLKEIGEAYGFSVVDNINISLSLNFKRVNIDGALIFSLKIPNKDTNKTYTVYRYDDGDIVKCRTSQSNSYIQFLTKKTGDFVILARDSVNTYDIPDYLENINSSNSAVDNQNFFIIGTIGFVLILYGIAMIIVYMIIERLKEKTWKDYKKLLLKVAIVQEEKLKN